MPTYVYRCSVCDLKFEDKEPMSAPTERECVECGEIANRIIVPGCGFILKTDGWSKTGYDRPLPTSGG